MNDHHDLVVVGAGIVGLATSLALLRRYPDLKLCLIEKEAHPAHHQSGHNSGVLHTGIYYVPGSLKARLCTQGRADMVEFCRQEDLPYEICGKVIVATNERELGQLDILANRAQLNGVRANRIDEKELLELEPHATGLAALHVPDAGITDYGAVARRLLERIEGYGARVEMNTRLVDVAELRGALRVFTTAGEISTKSMIACAGLQSDRISRLCGSPPQAHIVPFRGEYYRLDATAQNFVRNLIYPVPDPDFPFLGVHLTRDVYGTVECGPNAVLNLGRECYEKGHIDPGDLAETLTYPGFLRLAARHFRPGWAEIRRSLSKKKFAQSVARLVPAIEAKHLSFHGAGIRAQAVSPEGKLIDDFLFQEGENILHVINAPSPAATSSLRIGEFIADRFANKLNH